MTLNLVTRLTLATLMATLLAGVAVGQTKPSQWEKQTAFAGDEFASNIITALERDREGVLWVGTDRTLVWTGDNGSTWTVVPLGRAQAMYRTGGIEPRWGNAAGETPVGQALAQRHTITCLAIGSKGVWVGTLNGLCLGDFSDQKRNTWYTFPPAAGGPGPEIWAVAEYQGAVWVSARGGLYRSSNRGKEWQKLSGNLPDHITAISFIRTNSGMTCWLAGFDAQPGHGGADLRYTFDNGKTWKTVSTHTASSVVTGLRPRVHRLVNIGPTLWACTRHGLARSNDDGRSWEKVSPSSGLTTEEVFDLTLMRGRLRAATSEGMFESEDSGKTWKQSSSLRSPVHRVVSVNQRLWLATDGGLVRRIGSNWRTFSARSDILCSGRTGAYGRNTLWIGTRGGLCFSQNAGRSWQTLTIADGLPSNRILCLANAGDRIWAGTDGGIWTSRGNSELARAYDRSSGLHSLKVRDIVVAEGKVWATAERGISVLEKEEGGWRTIMPGENWFSLCLSKETLNESRRIIGAIADRNKGMAVVRLNVKEETLERLSLPGYNGERVHQITQLDDSIWAATDAGLFRSRDHGTTWARFGVESLWASRITRMARGPDHALCIQTASADPPSPTAILNFTHDDGRSWQTLPTPVPGKARTLLMFENTLVAGTRDGLYFHHNFTDKLRRLRTGWRQWNRIAAMAESTYRNDQLGHVSAVDDFSLHGTSFWLGSNGAGVIERGVPTLDSIHRAWDITGTLPLDISRFARFAGNRIHAITLSPEGVWFGTSKGIIHYDRIGRWRHFAPSANGLCGVPARALAVHKNQLWVGANAGLSALNIKTSRWQTFRAGDTPPLLPDNRVTALASDGENLWGGTERGGFRIDQTGHWTAVLPGEHIHAIEVGSARQYYGTDRGVFALDRTGRVRRQLNQRNCPELKNDRVINIFVDGPELWVATSEGIRKILHDPAEPEIDVTAVPSLRGPAGVLIVVNTQSADSVKIGEAYAALRNIPETNICRIDCPPIEAVRPNVYEQQIRQPLWRFLANNGLARKISFIVTTRGVPLRILADSVTAHTAQPPPKDTSIDSELALLARRHPTHRGIRNPYLHREEPFDSTHFGFYIVTRLDGPKREQAIGLARRAVAVEKHRSYATRGFVRFDLYSSELAHAESVNNAILYNYRFARRQNILSGRIAPPETTALPFFRSGECYNTFFFIGWGMKEYKPQVFSWVQGAIGVCLDPATALTLHDPKKSWTAGAIDAGITASVGHVGQIEPDAFMSVAGLYRYLMAGFTWGEAAYMCLPELSGQSVIIGDPLYTPFK